MGEGERGVDNLPIGGFNKNKNKLQDISKKQFRNIFAALAEK